MDDEAYAYMLSFILTGLRQLFQKPGQEARAPEGKAPRYAGDRPDRSGPYKKTSEPEWAAPRCAGRQSVLSLSKDACFDTPSAVSTLLAGDSYKKEATMTNQGPPPSTSDERLVKRLLALLIGLVLVLVAIGAYLFARDVSIRTESVNWPTVPGTVIASEVSTYSNWEGGNQSYPDVTYEYFVGGARYVDTETRFSGNAEHVVAQYPVGQPVTVHYNPKRPSQGVLVTGWDSRGCLCELAALGGALMLLLFGVIAKRALEISRGQA